MGKKRILIVLLLIVSITLIASTKALVIGIGDYRDTTIEQLPGAIEDARAFAEALSRNEDIEVKIRKNLTLSEMNVELSKWSREGEAEDTIILYFAGHGYTLKDEAYLIPSDANSGYIRDNPDKVAYNLAKGLKELSENIRAKEVLIIIDACYSGSLIKGARPLQDVRISEYSIDSLIKEKGYVFLLSSKSNETSGQMYDGRGHFTHYLLKGIEGEANRDNDDKITVKEVYDYLREEVRKATSNNQTPVMVGEREIVIAKDLRGMYDSLTLEIARMAREGRIDTEYTGLYLKILIQKENDDNELEKKVRGHLLSYLNKKDLEALKGLTRLAMIETGTPTTEQQSQQVQVTTPQTQPKGNCLLKITAGNELAKSGSVYLNGIMEGTLQSGLFEKKDMSSGKHHVVIDGEGIEKIEIEITFRFDGEMIEETVIAEPGKGILRIETIPPGARVYIDGEEQQSRSTMQVLIVLGIHDIRVVLEGYREESAKVNLREKNKMLTVPLLLSEHPSPDKPQLTYPSNNSRDIATGNITLKWESKESDLTYRIEFDGKTYTTKNKSYTVSASERGKTYSWKVTATNEWGKETVSDTYSFATKVNSAPEITLVSPVNASAGILANSITLKWTGKDSDGDEISYRVYFGETSSPTYITTTKESEYKVSNKDWGKRYYWKVEASDNYGGVTTSQVNSFTTQENRAPNAPSVPSPYNYATNQPTTITLSWECSDPDGDAVTYDVYFDTKANPTTKISTSQSGKTLSKGNLSAGTTYYWKVVAKDSKGATTEGAVWRFTTQSNRPPNTPSNPSPSNNATNRMKDITLSWDCSDPDGDAITYDIYFGTNNNPGMVIEGQSENTFTRRNLITGTNYYWKVVAKDSKGATTEGPEWRFTTSAVPEGMVLVGKGSFTMGDEFGDLWDSCRPTHKVTFTYDFYIGKYEVTFNEYDAFCNAIGGNKPKDEGWGRGQRPAINVSWNDAIAYCNWLSEKEKLPKAYDNNGNLLDKDGRVTTDPSKVVGYRLPTEAEWEYAARGGNKSKGYKYAGSDNVSDVAWYSSNSGGETQEVGKKAPNELGIYDMSGNVWEWCSDWFGNYSSSAQTNPYNSTAGSYRVRRGGSWLNGAADVRVANRGVNSPTFANYSLGFRIARTVP